MDKKAENKFSKWINLSITLFLIGIGHSKAHANALQSQIVINHRYGYDFAYDGRTRTPSWILEILTPESIAELNQSNVQYYDDSDIPESLRSKLSDYQSSGFSVGNLLTVKSKKKNSLEYPLSVTCPQLPEFNQNYWMKIENYTKELVKKLDVFRVISFTGPLYLPYKDEDGNKYVTYQVIGEDNVAIPTHFFKVIVYPTKGDKKEFMRAITEAYVIPNKNIDMKTPLDSFKISLEELEKISGIVFPKDLLSYFILPRGPHFP